MTKSKTIFFLRNTWHIIGYYALYLRSVFILLFWDIKRPAVFEGYRAMTFAVVYARKRNRKWKRYWDQGGKQQAVLMLTQTKYIVCSKMEVEGLQKKGVFPKGINPRKAVQKYSLIKTKI